MAKDFQIRGANVQKNSVRDRVQSAIRRLREANQGLPDDQRREITQEDIEKEAPVARKTLEKSYHRDLMQEVLRFLGEINVGIAVAKPKPPRPAPKSSIFKQNVQLLETVAALRYRLQTELAELQTELAEKQRQLDAKDVRIAALTDEIAKLHKGPRLDRTKPPKEATRRRQVA